MTVMADRYPKRPRLLPSGQAALEHGLEGASIGVRITDGLLELHGGAATGGPDGRHLVVEEGPFRETPPDLGVASACRASQRAGHGGGGGRQRQANRPPPVRVEGGPGRR